MGKKLTFWHFPTATCEGVNFLKVKIESVVGFPKAVKRKFYITHMYKTGMNGCGKVFNEASTCS